MNNSKEKGDLSKRSVILVKTNFFTEVWFGHTVQSLRKQEIIRISFTWRTFFAVNWRRRWGIKSGTPCLYMEDSFSQLLVSRVGYQRGTPRLYMEDSFSQLLVSRVGYPKWGSVLGLRMGCTSSSTSCNTGMFNWQHLTQQLSRGVDQDCGS